MNLCLSRQPRLRRWILSGLARGSDPASLLASGGLSDPDLELAARREVEHARLIGATILTLADPGYPPLLRASSSPPPLLYVRGRLRPEDALAIAVVGSRRVTPQGSATARRIAAGLAARGFTVVSGLARGVDAAGHRGALAAGGRTLAVLGSGLDRIYPAEHRDLAGAIASQGAVLSEFPFGTAPLKRNFPERNRVIAWSSWATVVVEAARDSGSLITAGLATDEGRAVYAVPGPVDEPHAEGTNALLREGALVCRGAEDVLDDLAPQLRQAAGSFAPARAGHAPADDREAGPVADARKIAASRLTTDQQCVLEAVPASRGIGIERLGQACGMSPGSLLAALLELELQGLVRQLPGRRFMAAGCKI